MLYLVVVRSKLMQKLFSIGLFTLSLMSFPQLYAKPAVTGWLEGVYVEGISNRLRAKLDSGALTSSIHGTNRRTFERDGERWLRFDFHWYKPSRDQWFGPVIVEAPLVRRVLIKDHEDDSKKRPVVNLHFSLNGECQITEFSVVDRSGFNYPVLLGRRFLEGKVLIDTRKSFTRATDRRGKSACKKLDDDKIEQTVKKIRVKKAAEKKAAEKKAPVEKIKRETLKADQKAEASEPSQDNQDTKNREK